MKKTLMLMGLFGGLITTNSISFAKDVTQAGVRTPVVLELFTSEGCSSCPPADRLLESLDAKQPFANADLIVLSEHVDYWNGGGWTDPYSSKFFSQRQRRYAEQFGLDGVYTPQLVVDGREEGVGSNAVQARVNVAKAMQSKKVTLTLSDVSRDGNKLKFHASAADLPAHDGPATLFIALAQNNARSEVQNGENAGRILTHVAVVKALISAGSVKGGSTLSKDFIIPLPANASALTGGFRLVAFLQSDKSQAIVGAVQDKL